MNTLFDEDAEYQAFCDKFKLKKTTDDCYTPEPVYEAVRDYVCARYGVDPGAIVRPFWPGADYTACDYPEGCTVLDNPPFSILSRIVRFYCQNGIRFFLFCPALTPFNLITEETTVLCTSAQIIYENGANVPTSFIHNLGGENVVESCSELYDILKEVADKLRKERTKTLPKLTLPPEILTAAKVNYLTIHHTPYFLRRGECCFIRNLDNYGKNVFGGGLLLSERAAAERAAAERAAAERAAAYVIELSEREREIQRMIGDKKK